MDVLLLGAAAIVLVALTLWIVWRPAAADETIGAAVRAEEASNMLPQGDRFEDQYTSATADLSAAGVALTEAQREPSSAAPPSPATRTQRATATPPLSDFQRASEPWSQPSLARESDALSLAPPDRATLALPEPAPAVRPRTVGIGAAALLTVGGAIGGAWLYARWQKIRNQPLNRLKRRFR